jgi:long-subunit fatty acid transport protein
LKTSASNLTLEKKRMVIKPRLSITFSSVLFCASILLAEGYRNPPEGARAIGAFGGHRAFADDANANIHNSANLVDLEQPMIQINTTFGYGKNKFETSGVSDETQNPFFAIPGFSAAVPLKDGKYALGFSSYIAYGRSVDWKDTDYFAVNGLPYAGSMTVADFTPNFAMRLSDSLSIGIGADIYYGEVKQWQYLGGAVKSKLTADGQGLGWNCALTWKMTEKQRLAATYRSDFTIKYEGDNDLAAPYSTTSDLDGKIEYPTIIGLAYGIALTDTLRAEIDGEWLDFSQYETLTIHDSTLGTIPAQQRLKDTWTTGFGLYWDFKPNWTLRSGFMYLKNPTPDDTYGPMSPDEDQGVVSIGLGYESEHHTFDIGYAAGIFDGRTIPSSNPAGGNYDYNVQLLALSYGYKF